MSGKRGLAGLASSIILCGLWLLGCQAEEPSANQVDSEPICVETGVLEQGTMENSSAFSYSFSVYLPPCYESDGEKAYPVLYLLPGRGSGPGSWFAAGANEKADEMISGGTVLPFIIVTTEEISSDPLAEVIFNDLIPHIENIYRVKTGRRYRSVAGGSLGSVGAYRLAFQHPGHFASAGMFGGGLVSGEEPRVEAWLDAIPEDNKPRVFLNTGEQDSLMLERAEVMIHLLDEKQIEHSEQFSPGEHTYAYWVSNFPTYFAWLAEDWE